MDQIKRLDVRIGDEVIVEKGGDVIPKIVEVHYHKRSEDSIEYFMDYSCPSCGSEIVKDEDGVHYRCINPECPAQAIKKIEYFENFNIEKLMKEAINKGFEGIVLKKKDSPYIEGRSDYWIKVKFNNDQIVVSTSTDGLTLLILLEHYCNGGAGLNA